MSYATVSLLATSIEFDIVHSYYFFCYERYEEMHKRKRRKKSDSFFKSSRHVRRVSDIWAC